MLRPADMSPWHGRNDAAEGADALRWHQRVTPWTPASEHGIALLGFGCDAGVTRNGGRPGAAQAPDALRRALANLAWHVPQPVFDAGDIVCEGDALEAAQTVYSAQAARLLDAGQRVIGLGGGHEIAWASWRGLAAHLGPDARIGIINIDAHFDMRHAPRPNSGTPFLQIAEDCRAHGRPFDYLVLGISELANTAALFATAQEWGVRMRTDAEMTPRHATEVAAQVRDFCAGVDAIYLTVCLDALPMHTAPGVSAPAAFGVELEMVEQVVLVALASGKLRLADVAELCPPNDLGDRTARVAARLVARLAGSVTPGT
jgi:formiminoglutamase